VHTDATWCEYDNLYIESCELERLELLTFLLIYKVLFKCDYICCVTIMNNNSYLLWNWSDKIYFNSKEADIYCKYSAKHSTVSLQKWHRNHVL